MGLRRISSGIVLAQWHRHAHYDWPLRATGFGKSIETALDAA